MKAAGPNMVHFVRKLKSIHPDLLISQPTYGYPQVRENLIKIGVFGPVLIKSRFKMSKKDSFRFKGC